MNVLVISPAVAGSRAGNRATALRYRKFLLEAGHDCRIEQAFESCAGSVEWPVDCAIVLHAIRGRYAIAEARRRGIPLVVVLTGTDYYKSQFTQPAEFETALEAADVLVCLHDLGYRSVPERFHSKLVVVKQSTAFEEEISPSRPGESDSGLTSLIASSSMPIAVIGHLREEKDPFRAALAAKLLPPESGIQILHAGGAHSSQWATRAKEEMILTPRYHWLGELSRGDTEQLLRQAALMIISSVMEGGANIVSEACALGCPVLASNIDGNMGLLGSDYPGLFEVGDEQALMVQLLRCETDPTYLTRLTTICQGLAADFTPQQEASELLDSVARACSASK